MELVRLGDASVESYELLLRQMKELITEAAPVAERRDGLGIADRRAAESAQKKAAEAGSAGVSEASHGRT